MNYYPHNIGDFAIETKYMTFEQKGIYVDLLDRYLSTGKPLATQWVATTQGAKNCSPTMPQRSKRTAGTPEAARRGLPKPLKTNSLNPVATQCQPSR